MANREYGHRVGKNGKAEVVETSLPRHMRGYDPEFDVHTFKEGPLSRLFNRKGKR
jgi:hypothetical protein